MDTAVTSTNPFKREQESAPEPTQEVQTNNNASEPEFDPLATPFGAPEDDDSFSFDLTGAQSQALIPANRYVGMLSELTKGTSSSGNPMWTFTFTILACADGSPTPFAGRTLRKFCALTPAAIGIFTNVIEALGLGKAGQPMTFKKNDALNRMVYFDVTIGKYNGEDQSNVGRLFPYQPIGQKYNRGAAGI